MNKTATTLKKELVATEKKAEVLRQKIKKQEDAKKPKDITTLVTTWKEVLKIAKPTKEELVIFNYAGKSERLIFARRVMRLSLVAEVLNEGHKFKMSRDEERHYPYFYIDVSSGFVFHDTNYVFTYAYTSSAPRLAFKNEKLVRHAVKYFFTEFKDVNTML
ncbi:MAG: hypothetical protein AAB966_00820 [Patescibacteria group bacterium]